MALFPQLDNLVSKIDIDAVSQNRRDILQPLVDYIRTKVNAGNAIRLNFICTHNSRRSHLSQVWAQAMAHYCGIGNVFAYSGGTESTALYQKKEK
ncbi:MAG: protein-tyrosine-phosphatase, partial [Crocinitomicaceae bacterium]